MQHKPLSTQEAEIGARYPTMQHDAHDVRSLWGRDYVTRGTNASNPSADPFQRRPSRALVRHLCDCVRVGRSLKVR